jgi:hypothetical protein
METEEDRLFQEWDVLYEALNADVTTLERLIEAEDCNLWRRSYCRAIFALIEATAEWMKRYTICCYYPGELGEKEKKELEMRSGVLLGFFVALDLFADTSGAGTPLKKDSNEWIALHTATKVRNRITHPKSPKDIDISDDDLGQLQATKATFISLVAKCLSDSGLALLHQADALRCASDSKKPKESLDSIAEKGSSR